MRWLLAIAAALMLAACGHDDDVITPVVPMPGELPAPLATARTVVVYMVAENSLSPYLKDDFQELRAGRANIPQDAQLVVYIDDTKEPRLYRLTSQQDTVRLCTWQRDICSTDYDDMCSVLDKVNEFCPGCQRYDMVMSSHASGWIPQTDRYNTRSFGVDNNQNSTSNRGVEMDISTLETVLANKLGHVGYIFFDACYMQCIEVAHQLRAVADYIVASPTEIPGTGANYTSMMPCLFAQDEAPAQIVQRYYDDEVAKRSSYAGVVISAIKTCETPDLAIAARPIVQQLCGGHATPSTAGVQTYGVYAYNTLYRPTYYDMWGLALQTDDDEALAAFHSQMERTVVAYRATKSWLTSFSSVFTPRIDDITRTCGVSMFLPEDKYDNQGWNTLYHDIPWYIAAGYDATGW